jgi:hypothetical protein
MILIAGCRLQLWLGTGQGHDRIIKDFIAVYPQNQDDLWEAIAQTKVIKAAGAEVARKHATRHIEERLRRLFKPFIWISTEESAHQFWTAVMERRIKVLWMDQAFELLSDPEKLAAVQTRVKEHYAGTKTYPGFGRILTYTFVPTFDTSLTLDVNGDVIDSDGSQFLLPEVWLELHP